MQKVTYAATILLLMVGLSVSAQHKSNKLKNKKSKKMEISNKQKAVAVIRSLETGEKEPVNFIKPNKYIQHNLGAGDGLAGFGALLANAPAGGFKAEVIRAYQDGDYVFLQTKYDFFGPKAGFDVFRFEDGKIVEHWDNLTEITAPNPSGRTQFDGETLIANTDKTESNKKIVEGFVNDVLKGGKVEMLTTYINPNKYLQHNSGVADGLDGLGAALDYFPKMVWLWSMIKYIKSSEKGTLY